MEQVTTWWWPMLSYLGYPGSRISGEALAHLWHICVITQGQPISCGWDHSPWLWHSSLLTFPLQPWAVTSPPCQLLAGLCPKSHFWALISPHFCPFPSWQLINVYHPKEYCTNPSWILWRCCHTQALSEQANGSLKQAHHPLRAADNRDSWPCLQTNALSFLGQEPGILRASGQVTTWYWYQLHNIRWNFNYHWKIQLEKPSLLFKELKAAQASHLLSSKKQIWLLISNAVFSWPSWKNINCYKKRLQRVLEASIMLEVEWHLH